MIKPPWALLSRAGQMCAPRPAGRRSTRSIVILIAGCHSDDDDDDDDGYRLAALSVEQSSLFNPGEAKLGATSLIPLGATQGDRTSATVAGERVVESSKSAD